MTDALDNEIDFAYDADGNMTSQTDARGNATTYTYNSLDQRGQTTFADSTNTYNANSNQTRIDQANGTATNTTYDALNRITEITHLDTTDAPIATLTYTLDPTGRRTAITEANGRVSSYCPYQKRVLLEILDNSSLGQVTFTA